MSFRFFPALFISLSLNAVAPPPPPLLSVDFPPDRIPRRLWARELIWLKNMGFDAVAVANAGPEFRSLAGEAGLTIAPASAAAKISVLQNGALLRGREQLLAHRTVIWSDVESETAPEFHRGGVDFSGEEDPALQTLRREAAVMNYWGPVLASPDAPSPPNKLPDSLHFQQKAIPEASAVSLINKSRQSWHGDLRVAFASPKRTLQIPNVTVPGQDALLLPVDVAFADPRFCRSCFGMSNSERLLYATAELTAMEYENGILSFEFYAPVAGVAVLRLEREPNGPMLAAGHPIAFDWDAENKRARLPIPAGKGAGRRVRIAITITAPDDVASFVDTHILIIGQTNRVLTDYSSDAFARKSRLLLPDGWKASAESKSPTQILYSIAVPPNRLHGDHAELRLEANGVGMSHVRVQLLRPVSVHIAENSALHFGSASELASDPPLLPVENPNGRAFTILLRNNAAEIRTFKVTLSGGGLEFSPSSQEISIGASMEREISVRAFINGAAPGLHHAMLQVRGVTDFDQPVSFVVIPRGGAVRYAAELTGTAGAQTVLENSRIRAVFSQPDGGRWIEFYWKESGKSLLPPEGVALARPVKMELDGDSLLLAGATNLPRGGHAGNVEWKAEPEGGGMRYRVTESTRKAPGAGTP